MKSWLCSILLACIVGALPATAAIVTFDFYSATDGYYSPLEVTSGGVTLSIRGFAPTAADVNKAWGGLGVDGSSNSALNPGERLTFTISDPGGYELFRLVSVDFGRAGGLFAGDDEARIAFPASAIPAIDLVPGDLSGVTWTPAQSIGLLFPHTNAQLSIRNIGANTTDVFRIAGLTFEAVPEPSTYVLVGLGLTGVALVRRRRKS